MAVDQGNGGGQWVQQHASHWGVEWREHMRVPGCEYKPGMKPGPRHPDRWHTATALLGWSPA